MGFKHENPTGDAFYEKLKKIANLRAIAAEVLATATSYNDTYGKNKTRSASANLMAFEQTVKKFGDPFFFTPQEYQYINGRYQEAVAKFMNNDDFNALRIAAKLVAEYMIDVALNHMVNGTTQKGQVINSEQYRESKKRIYQWAVDNGRMPTIVAKSKKTNKTFASGEYLPPFVECGALIKSFKANVYEYKSGATWR